jgi:GrpB-like predicted nucleotidyltransferase (UPF0157 family)
MVRKMSVVEHDEKWKGAFLAEKELLHGVFKDVAVAIHHIGSTAIPSIKAKPIIDILIEVSALGNVDNLIEEMRNIGFVSKGENGIENRRYFQKGGDSRTHHIHCFPVGHPEINRHLLFRDYLLAHPKKAAEYSALKEKLSEQFLYDTKGYVNGKNQFVRQVDKEAGEWAEGD